MFFAKKPKTPHAAGAGHHGEASPSPIMTAQEAEQNLLEAGDVAGFTALQKQLTREAADRLRSSGGAGPLFLTCQPKSASKTIRKRLMDTFSLPHEVTWDGFFPEIVLSRIKMRDFREKHAVTQGHIPASALNRQIIELFATRVLCQVRDPRPAIYSLMHMMERYKNIGHMNMMFFQLPTNYFHLSLSEKIDLFIEKHYEAHVKFIQDWVASEQDSNFKTPVLILSYEQFCRDPQAYFTELVSFLQLDPAKLAQLVGGENANFRSGNVAEWEDHFTPQQKRDAAALSPPDLMNRFGWET